MTFGLWILALAIATLGQVSTSHVGCGIGNGQDICSFKRPLSIQRLPLVVRPVDLPRPVIEFSTPKPAPAPPTAPPATIAPIPVPPLLPLGGPCSCKRTLVRPAIVPKPVCQCQQKCVSVCSTNCNQKTVSDSAVVSGGYSASNGGYSASSAGYSASSGGYSASSGGYSASSGGYSASSGGYSGSSGGILSGVSSVVGEAVDSLFGSDSVLGGDDSVSSIIDSLGGGDAVSTIIGGDDSVSSIIGGGDAITTITGGADSGYGYSDSIVGGLGTIVDSSGGAVSTFIDNGAYGSSDGFVNNVDVLGGGSTIVQTGGAGGVVETIVDGPYVDTIVAGGRRCVDLPYDACEDDKTEARSDPSDLPADAVSLAIAYNLAKKACELSEDKLFYGFRQIPKEVPRRVINRRIIGRRIADEGNLYNINGDVVELKAPSTVTTPKSLAEEAAEDLLDLVAEEQEQGTDYVVPIRKITLGEIGYAPTKRRSPTFIDIPAPESDIEDDVADAVGEVVESAVKSATCADGFRAGRVAVLPVPQREVMLSRPKLETLLEPCSSEEEYGPVPQSVKYTTCRKSSRRSSSSSSSGLLSSIVAKLV